MNIDKVRNEIRPLDLGAPFVATEEEQRYFAFYGIDFENALQEVEHYFGVVECQQHQIACHYFASPRAERTCFVVHGYMDHVGLYNKVIEYLLHRGCNVVAFDFPGHGLSSGEQASIGSFGDYVLVLRHCLEFFYQKVPSPWHVIAQSMGGAVVMDYLLSQQYDESTGPFDRVLLLAPLVRTRRWLGIRLAHWALKGWVAKIRRNFSGSSHDEEFLQFLEHDDPLQTRYIPIQWITAMLQWEQRFRRLSWGEMEVLIVQGEGDQTVNWQYNLRSIGDKFPKAKYMRISEAGHHLAGEAAPFFERVVQAADLYFDRRKQPRD